MNVTDVCQLGLTKSYQVNQLFSNLTVRENLTIAALAENRGRFRMDVIRNTESLPGVDKHVTHTAALVNLTHRLDVAVRSEEHTSELQSLMRISYAVFCLKKKTNTRTISHILLQLTIS